MAGKILIFSCNWDGWSCVDAASNAGLTYPASVNIIKLTCLSSLNAGSILRAFEFDVDGVMLIGCQGQQCQYGQYGKDLEREYVKAKEILKLMGINEERILFTRLAPFDGKSFVEQLNKFMAELSSPAFSGKT